MRNTLIRRLLVGASLLLGIGAVATKSTLPLQVGLPTMAALGGLWFGRSVRNHVWSLLGLFSVALIINALAWRLTSFSGWRAVADVSLIAVVFFGGAAAWLVARPSVSEAQRRSPARIAISGLVLILLSVVLLDARNLVDPTNSTLTIGFAGIGIAGLVLLAAASINLARLSRGLNREAETVLIFGTLLYATFHLTSMTLDSVVMVRLGAAVGAAATLMTVTSPNADRLGAPIETDGDVFQVRLWPLVFGSLAMAAAHASLQFDIADGTLGAASVVIVCGAFAVMMFVAREIGGPRKPLVVPFGRRDRALQKLPSALLGKKVRLVGQPVRRTADSTLIGIEAQAQWVAHDERSVPIDIAAEEAGLSHLLDSITLRLAQVHLPAVLNALDADEPWLSIPLHVNTAAASALPANGSVDGLVLRVATAEIAKAVDDLRDHGAMLQAPQLFAADVEAEIVTDVPTNGRPTGISRRLIHSSVLEELEDGSLVSLVVDDTSAPTSLAAILAPIAPEETGAVRRIP